MANFSPGLSTIFHYRHFVSLNIPSMCLLKLTFQPGLKFCCDYMRFFSLPARAENPSPVQKPSPCNRHFHFKRISFRTLAEISARLTGLKFAMESPPKFSSGRRYSQQRLDRQMTRSASSHCHIYKKKMPTFFSPPPPPTHGEFEENCGSANQNGKDIFATPLCGFFK